MNGQKRSRIAAPHEVEYSKYTRNTRAQGLFYAFRNMGFRLEMSRSNALSTQALLLLTVILISDISAVEYEETVVWQPDAQHKYVALREVTDSSRNAVAAEAIQAPSPPTNASSKQPQADSQIVATSTEVVVVPAKAPIPEFSFGVWNPVDGTVCILAKFQAFFTISYNSRGGHQTVTIKMPETAKSKGVCATETTEPILELTWPIFRFTMLFARTPGDKNDKGSWSVHSLTLQFNTNSQFFPGAINTGVRTARSGDNMTLFETPMGESYFCPTPKLVTLTESRGARHVAVQFKDLRIQAYEFLGTYGPAHRCSQVRMAGVQDPFPQDETVPIAVGSTLAVMAVAVVVGYAIYRSVLIRRVDYNTMN
ncbi:lysosome-associated membrane glycoprotein 1-like [Ornithodoros turicata]|uniref:lysosome-associated membrane glycoprotein 1-like n=1 Tax=Ornithodoros turicata TaxID=34597 RepID=UPI0031396584